MASSDLEWLLIRKYNSFMVKAVPEGPVLSREPVGIHAWRKKILEPVDGAGGMGVKQGDFNTAGCDGRHVGLRGAAQLAQDGCHSAAEWNAVDVMLLRRHPARRCRNAQDGSGGIPIPAASRHD